MDNMNLTSPEDWVDYQEGYLAIKDHKGEPARCLLSKYKSYQMEESTFSRMSLLMLLRTATFFLT